MKTLKKEQILKCSNFNQLLNAEYGERGTQSREQFEAEAEAFALGELLRQERETIGLTQQQLAEQSGYNKKTISRLESGHSDVSLSSIFHIFAGMGRKVAVSVLTILLLLTLGVGQMWAETATTVYYAVPSTTVGTYTVKLNVNYKGDGDEWATHTMASTGRTTSDGKIIYSCSFTDKYNGLGQIQIQFHKSDGWVSQIVPFSTWTNPTVYNGKMWIHGGNSWTDHSPAGYAYFVAGDNGDGWLSLSWNTTDDTYKMSGTTTQSITISSVSNASHTFKVSTYNWGQSWGYDSEKVTCANGTASNSDGNISFTPSHAGSVKITYNPSTGNIQILAPYQVSYAAGTGATGTVSASAVTTYGSTCTLSSSTFSKTGYTQDGWATSDGGSKAYNLGVSYTGGYTDVTLYPYWAGNEYAVTLNREEGTTGSTSVTAIYNAAMPSATMPTRTGYDFQGYFASAGGSGTKYYNADGTSAHVWDVANAATIHAHWTEKTYNVTVTSNNFSYGTVMGGETSAQTVSAKHFTSDCAITAEAKSGYRFTGWTYSGSVVIADASATSTTIKATATGATVTANFEALPSGQLDIVAGANGQVKKESGSWGSSASYTDINTDTDLNIYAQANTGYHFDNWTKSGDGSIKTNAASGVYTLPGRGSATVTANFAANSYAVTLDRQSGTTGSTSVSATYNADMPSATMPTRTGYDFQGYFGSTGGSGTKYYSADGSSAHVWDQASAQTIYAHWTIHNYSITYSPSSAPEGCAYTVKPTSADYNTTVSMTITPSDTWHHVSVSVAKAGGGSVEITQDGNVFTFTQPEDNVTVTVTCTDLHTGIYLPNAHNSWNKTDANYEFKKVYGSSPEAATLELNIDKEDAKYNTYHQFGGFIIWHNSWDTKEWKNSSTEDTKMTSHNCTGWGFNQTGGESSTYLDLPLSGTYTFTLTNYSNSASQALTVTYPDKSFVEGDFETSWGEHYTMTDDGTTESVTVNITSVGDKEFRLVSHGKLWGTATKITKGSNSQTLYGKHMTESGAVTTVNASVVGEYTFTYNKSTHALTVAYPSVDQLQIYSSSFEGEDPAVANVNWDSHEGNVYSKTVTLKASTSYTFKAVVGSDFYANGGTITRSTSTSSNTLSSLNTSGNNMTITADIAGSYTFTFDISAKTLVVTYPTAYQVTYSKSIVGTDNETTAAPSASYNSGATSVTSGETWIPSGTEVTFTAAAAGSGYTWKGWYSVEDPHADYSANILSSEQTYAPTVSAATTIYAVYEETLHTVTITAGAHGSITTPAGGSGETVIAGIATAPAIVAAVADYGYVFSGWTVESGSATFGNSAALSTTVNATSDATIKANFVSHWTVVGGDSQTTDGEDAMGNWNEYANAIDNFVQNEQSQYVGFADIILPANTTFYLKIRDLHNTNWYGNTGEMTYTNNEGGTMESDTETNCRITTAGAGTYRFTWNENTFKLTVTYPTSYTVTYGYGTGGTSVTARVEGDAAALSESGKYAAEGKDVTFTQTPATGYTFKGWYTTSDGNTTVSGMGLEDAVLDDIAANASVYAQYTENMTAVTLAHTGNGHIEIDDATVTSTTAGVATTRSITAVPDEGWYFAGWTVSDGADCAVASTAGRNDNESSSTTLSGLGAGTTGTVTANFVENDKIYFRNENETTGGKLWDEDNIYVYYTVGWGKNGSEYDGVTTSVNTKYAQMAPISSGSKIYWAYVPHSFTTTIGTGTGAVAFSNKWMGSDDYPASPYGTFNKNQGVYRTDYCKHLNMYVPASKESNYNNETSYRSNGFWMKYNNIVGQDASYYLKEGNQDNQVDIFKATADNSTKIVAQYRFENTSDHTFFIANASGQFYKSANITSVACTEVDLVDDAATPAGFTITPTSEGYYTFYIEQSGDTMKVSVVYPISAGDYQLVYTYDSGSKTRESDIIKPYNASSTNVKKSMYIDPSKTGDNYNNSLKLRKCTRINSSTKLPEWTDGVSIQLTPFTNGKGVYEFDMAITDGTANNEEVTSVSLDNVKIYEGDYYIKTDYAPGGWVNYKQNSLYKNTINFDKAKTSTFDYYFCKWIEEGDKNVKCIIANDYNEQITDTLIGDAILGKYWDEQKQDSVTRQYLAYAANVRFSYNSYTNELKRAYLNGSTDWQETFLRISAGDANHIRNKYTHQNLAGYDTTFTDNYNWIYQLDLEAKPGARVKVTANYRFSNADHEQYFIGQPGDYSDANTEQILGGSTDEWLGFRIIYDFKTNKLIAAYLPQDMEVNGDKPIEADIMFIRSHNGNAGQLTFTNDKKLTDVKKAYGVMEFNKTTILDDTKPEAERALYWISFPFNVKASEIFGIGEYGKQWILEYYDGEARAREGQWVDSPTRWTFVDAAMRDTLVLRKGMGYVLALDLDEMKKDAIWVNGVTSVHLYFPSADNIGDITGTLTSVTIPPHPCEITRNNRNIWDSNWNVIGVPAYWNIANFSTPATPQPDNAEKILTPGAVGFYYKWDAETNSFSVETSASTETFQTMYSYLVQFAGTIIWSTKELSSVAARRVATEEEKDKWTLDLHVAQDGTDADHTYIEFRDDVTDAYDMNSDLVKNANGNQTIVYTLLEKAYMPDPTATVPVRMGANCLAVPAETKTVAVGVIAGKAGEYTFSMPEGTDGMDVTLIDYELNRETNLSLGDYTAVLEKGTCDARFALRINRKNTVTSLEGCNGSELRTAGAEKVMINGNLYIRQNGQSYDAQGKRVE